MRFSKTAAIFRNKVEVGVAHSVELDLSSDDLAELQAVLADVTEDPQTVADAIQTLNEQAKGDGLPIYNAVLGFTNAAEPEGLPAAQTRLVDHNNVTSTATDSIQIVGVNALSFGDLFAA